MQDGTVYGESYRVGASSAPSKLTTAVALQSPAEDYSLDVWFCPPDDDLGLSFIEAIIGGVGTCLKVS